MKKTIAFIPARGGSKRIPNKNITSFGDLPLIAHSIHYAKANADIIDEVYVSTDDGAIKTVALKYGAKVIDRPEALSGDCEPTITAMKHALSVIEDEIDTMVLLQPTNPLRPKTLLKDAYETFVKTKSDSLFTLSRDDKKLGKINDKTFEPFNYEIGQRSQDLKPLYYENGLLYITKAALIQKDVIFNEASFPYIVNHKFANVDIDTQDDLDYAEYILKHYHEH